MSRAEFSGAVKIAPDALNDFIAPSQDCVVALEGKRVTLDELEDDGHVVVRQRRSAPSSERVATEPVKVTLSDCLACSGCVTSAESVLLEQQSAAEFAEACSQARGAGVVVVASVSPQSLASLSAAYGLSDSEARERLAGMLKTTYGATQVYDVSFARDLALTELYAEFVERTSDGSGAPLLASACPGWVCYAEKTHGELAVPHMATTKSPQQIMGTFVKTAVARNLGVTPNGVYHVSIMPCYDKKLEASRDDFVREGVKDVDVVLTTGEVTLLLEKAGLCHLRDAPRGTFDSIASVNARAPESEHAAPFVSSSGGYAEYVFRRAAAELFNAPVHGVIEWVPMRNQDMREATLTINNEVVLRVAVAYGFRNIQNLVRMLKMKKTKHQFVEVMACPSGCLNGGGQLPSSNGLSNKELLYALDEQYREIARARPMADVHTLYREWIGGEPGSQNAREMLRTCYHARSKTVGVVQLNSW